MLAFAPFRAASRPDRWRPPAASTVGRCQAHDLRPASTRVPPQAATRRRGRVRTLACPSRQTSTTPTSRPVCPAYITAGPFRTPRETAAIRSPHRVPRGAGRAITLLAWFVRVACLPLSRRIPGGFRPVRCSMRKLRALPEPALGPTGFCRHQFLWALRLTGRWLRGSCGVGRFWAGSLSIAAPRGDAGAGRGLDPPTGHPVT